MKRNFKNGLLAGLLAVCLVLSACGSSPVSEEAMAENQIMSDSFDTMGFYTEPDSLPVPRPGKNQIAANNGGDKLNTTPDSQRKIIKNVSMTLETKDFMKSLEDIKNMCSEAGGYIEQESVNGASLHDSSDIFERNARITFRIPADKLGEFIDKIGTTCNVAYKNEYADDITDRYYDTDAHLKMLKVQEERLLELLKKATDLTDVIELEKALTDCRYEIESIEGRLRRMDSQVAYATVSISLNEVVEYQVPQAKPLTFGERVAESFKRSGRKLKNLGEDILFFIIEDLPALIISVAFIGGIIALIVLAVKKLTKKKVSFGFGKKNKAPDFSQGFPKSPEEKKEDK